MTSTDHRGPRVTSGLVAVVTACLLVGCSFISPPSPPVEREPEPVLVEPPKVFINGVAGKPYTWCWGGACVDGWVYSPEGLGRVSPPFRLHLPPGGHIEAVDARGPGLPGRQPEFDVPWVAQSIGEPPDGTIILDVSIRFADGGDAAYAWALDH